MNTKRLFAIALTWAFFWTFLLGVSGSFAPHAFAKTLLVFTEQEQALIKRSQEGHPIKMGVIPHLFPLSSTPPESPDFTGITVNMLKLISVKSGIVFDYVRIPTEDGTPYDFLKKGTVPLVAGTIRLDRFSKDSELLLSSRLSDGASLYIAKKGFVPNKKAHGRIASKHGYQAGMDTAAEEFPAYEVTLFDTNHASIASVRADQNDMAVINRYTGMYELQKPINAELVAIPSRLYNVDSCIMGLNSPETSLLMDIINKTLAAISPGQNNHVHMHFLVTNPYQFTLLDTLYLYRYPFLVGFVALVLLGTMSAKLLRNRQDKKQLSMDPLTGAHSDAGFHFMAPKRIARSKNPLFIIDFDVLNFQGYNELHGRDAGDALLRNIVEVVKTVTSRHDIISRVYADNFRVLSSIPSLDRLIEAINTTDALFREQAKSALLLSYGIYSITDTTVPIEQMLDFAKQAKKSVKYTSDKNIGVFDTELHRRSLKETEMFTLFQNAIDSNQFLAHYQPKYDAITTKIIGAEALVRWQQNDGTLLSPFHFVDLFERNGQIRRLDFYMLNQVCKFQKSLLDKGITPVPVSVNFSRVHLYSDNLPTWIDDIVEMYQVPKRLIEIEWTETAIMNDNSHAEKILKALQESGYSMSMDDFGSAYSSLNTLCNMPLDVIKLDREFMINTLNESEGKKDKAHTVISSIIGLARKLKLKVVAEGVEIEAQYLFLKEAGCDYIQGYYFSKPVEEDKFLALLIEDQAR